jgi:glutamate dehydrogenase/leucine dehydrogenase
MGLPAISRTASPRVITGLPCDIGGRLPKAVPTGPTLRLVRQEAANRIIIWNPAK